MRKKVSNERPKVELVRRNLRLCELRELEELRQVAHWYQRSIEIINKKDGQATMVFKKGEKRTPGKTAGGSQDATKDTVAKKVIKRGAAAKKNQETYSVYIYRVLK